jgi:hypothetical protein
VLMPQSLKQPATAALIEIKSTRERVEPTQRRTNWRRG